jgi:NOL1/NOP2/sun family putative RNA methylase
MVPNFLVQKLEIQYGSELAKEIIKGYGCNRPVTIRVNTLKTTTDEIKQELSKLNIQFKTVQWSKNALILENVQEKEIQEQQIYQNGSIYMQSLSSMLPPIILNPKENTDILDMAAAPGGKTTQIAALTNNLSHITACELNKIRAERLKYNLEKQGANCVYVMEKDARQIDNFFSFDQILLDAPCSGSGTIQVNNEKLQEIFTPKLIQKSISSQKALLRKAINILKPGCEMVYSTCSILKEENEEIVNTVLIDKRVKIVPISLDNMEELPLLPVNIDGTICVRPNELYEGFFIAKIKKL